MKGSHSILIQFLDEDGRLLKSDFSNDVVYDDKECFEAHFETFQMLLEKLVKEPDFFNYIINAWAEWEGPGEILPIEMMETSTTTH